LGGKKGHIIFNKQLKEFLVKISSLKITYISDKIFDNISTLVNTLNNKPALTSNVFEHILKFVLLGFVKGEKINKNLNELEKTKRFNQFLLYIEHKTLKKENVLSIENALKEVNRTFGTTFIITKHEENYVIIPKKNKYYKKEGILSTSGRENSYLKEIIDRITVSQKVFKIVVNQQKEFREITKIKYSIKKLTTNFIGREFVFGRIKTFIKEHQSGYFTVKGNAGIGKSALAVKYANDNKTLLHIIDYQKNSKNTAKHFIKNICLQLIEKHNLPIEELPFDYDKDGDYLEEILIKVSKRLIEKQKIVITVDGLDELSDLTQFEEKNILHLPEVLPKGIFFLMTMRNLKDDDVRMPLNEGNSEIYPLEHDGVDNKADVLKYIEMSAKNEGIQEYLKKHSKKESDFIKKVEGKAEGNFMYLVHVLKEIEDGDYKDLKLNDLPQGLEGYYRDHWKRMTKNISIVEEEVKYKTIYLLSDLKTPVSAKTLGNIIKSNVKGAKIITVQKALEQWQQFLNISYKDNTKEYALYHKSFSDFLKEKDMIKLVGFNYDDVNKMILKHIMGDFIDL